MQRFQHPFQRATKYLQVYTQTVCCAIELQRIERVISLMNLKPVPDGPDYLAGIFDYHGMIVPVIDLTLRLGEPRAMAYDVNSSVLICETMETGAFLGIIVEVGDVMEIEYKELQLAPEFSDKQTPFFACYQQGSTVYYLLNSAVLLDSSLSTFGALSAQEIKEAIASYEPH